MNLRLACISDFACHASCSCPSMQGGEAAGAQGQLWSCAEVGGPMPTVSATAPATATRRPPSPILTHRLRWHIAAHLVGDEVFTFGRPR